VFPLGRPADDVTGEPLPVACGNSPQTQPNGGAK
jgi:hypothetical protein